MNLSSPKNKLDHEDQGILDAIELLVESELSDTDRNQLLAQFEAKPEYWRVLAIAFVEQQSIVRSVKAASALVAQSEKKAVHGKSHAPSSSRTNWQQLAMTAAALLLMFALGYSIANRAHFTDVVDERRLPTNESGLAQEVAQTNEPTKPENQRATAFPIAQNVAGYVQWDEETGTKLFPLFRGDKVDESWLASHPLVLDKRVVESLTQSGWAANPSRRFVSIKLLDGASYTIPVDDIQYRFVGRSVY
jgi:hypothetical protein